ncbi:MAG: hypothetical protein H6724_11435 [Sandaracinus sp.]|nr:hypothetical protein [Sandaracinus sp.]
MTSQRPKEDLEPIPASDDAPGRLWRTAPTDVEQAAQIAADLAARSVTNVAFIAQRGAYGDGLVALLEARIAGLQVVRFETAGQLSSALGVVADGSASEVIFASSSTAEGKQTSPALSSSMALSSSRTPWSASTSSSAGCAPSDAGLM